MSIVLANNTLLSFIAALDLSKNSGRDVYLKSDIPEHFGRYFSINEFSKIYLDNLGVWKKISADQYVPYKNIEIYLNDKKSLEFKCDDQKAHNLGYIISEGVLLDAVSKCINETKSIKEQNQQNFSATGDMNICSNINEPENIKNLFKFKIKNYEQTALNITFEHTNNNNREPRQIFFNDEILGLLPVDNNTYNLIWSMPNSFFSSMKTTSSNEMIKCLAERVGFIVGDIGNIDIGKSFPLSSRHSNNYFFENYILIGDAAHKYHPLAGLGLNMGIEDVATLSYLLANNENVKTVFYQYAIKRMSRAQSLQHILDTIIVFHSSDLMPIKIKKKILDFFNETFYLKPKIIENATGLNNKDLVNL